MSKERQLLRRAATYLQNDCSDGAEKIRAEIKSLLEEPEAEPVGVFTGKFYPVGDNIVIEVKCSGAIPRVGDKLYTHPPRQPVQLSDDELIEILKEYSNPIKFARAVIAAYEEKQNGR